MVFLPIKPFARACKRSGKIIDTRFAKGARHDFSLYKRSKASLPDEVKCLADSGYQGLTDLRAQARTPVKKPKGGFLTDEQKLFNKELAAERVAIEHIIRQLKIFAFWRDAIAIAADLCCALI